MMMKMYEILNLGTTALALVGAFMNKDPHMFSTGLMALLTGVGSIAKIKEMDPAFIASLQPDIDGLTTKIFAHIG